MSLINEALRKARQAASEHESKQPEGPFQPARAYPSRRSGRGGGLLAIALIAVAAGVVGAAAGWWFVGDRETASSDTTMVEGPAIEAATPLVTPPEFPTPVDDRAAAASPEAPAQQEPAPVEVEQPVLEPAPAVAVVAGVSTYSLDTMALQSRRAGGNVSGRKCARIIHDARAFTHLGNHATA